MTIATDARTIVVPGKVEILVAFPSAYTSLFRLGESEDGIEIRKRHFMSGIKGDSYGGSAGPDMEKQFMGMEAEFNLKMSKWDPATVAKIEGLGGLLATPGTIPLASFGALLMASRGMRFLLVCTRDSAQTINFPCCLPEQPITSGKQTKYSSCGIGITAHRAPENFWEVSKAGVLYDSDVTGTT